MKEGFTAVCRLANCMAETPSGRARGYGGSQQLWDGVGCQMLFCSSTATEPAVLE